MGISGFGLNGFIKGAKDTYSFLDNIDRQHALDRQRAKGITRQNKREDTADLRAKDLYQMKKTEYNQGQDSKTVKKQYQAFEYLTTDVNGNQLKGDALAKNMPQITALFNQIPLTNKFLSDGENVDKETPLAGFIPTDRGTVMIELNAKHPDGTHYNAPLTKGRTSDPNDPPVEITPEQIFSEMGSYFAAHGHNFNMTRKERRAIDAKVALADKKHKYKLDELGVAAKSTVNQLGKINQKDFTNESFKAFSKSSKRSDLVPYRSAAKNIPSSVSKQDIASMAGILEGSGIDSGIAKKASPQAAMVYKQAMEQGMSQRDAVAKIVQGVASGTVTDTGLFYDSKAYDPGKANFSGQGGASPSQVRQPQGNSDLSGLWASKGTAHKAVPKKEKQPPKAPVSNKPKAQPVQRGIINQLKADAKPDTSSIDKKIKSIETKLDNIKKRHRSNSPVALERTGNYQQLSRQIKKLKGDRKSLLNPKSSFNPLSRRGIDVR